MLWGLIGPTILPQYPHFLLLSEQFRTGHLFIRAFHLSSGFMPLWVETAGCAIEQGIHNLVGGRTLPTREREGWYLGMVG